MYLSRLILNPRSRQVQRELADPYEMHRTISRSFRKEKFRDNESSGILFRVDLNPKMGIPTLLVQSKEKPDWDYLRTIRKDYLLDENSLPPGMENSAWKEINMQLHTGQALAFRLRANPTVKKDREGKKQGQRVGVINEENQRAWLKRKLESAGAALVAVNISNGQLLRGKLFIEKEDDKRMRFLSVQFDGILKVKDPAVLQATLQAGIGSGKGLGFGLLSLAPARG